MRVLNNRVAELHTDYTNHTDDKVILKSYQDAKEAYNMAVVGIEHLWREMSHLYEVDQQIYGK